ncbi:hypothetical protein EI545_16815 [Tabrizicola piscis]|uniref:Oxidoreductase n=1 Tax=Tabrizicola piscis TaxID=2494374 RepID=A0A3S8U9Q6_9RHOB|nr:hypothetical protein [Tabrizicola piscis]AZL60337.1 hypothetical protein EI545_16815 [Tabrizicola piscis]
MTPAFPTALSPAFSMAAFLAETGPLAPTKAERALLQATAEGSLCRLSDSLPDPEDPTAPRIRAALLQHLVTGGCDLAPVAPAGVRVLGAVIVGPLTLNFATARGETDLRACAFTDPINARRAQLVQLVLSGSRFPALLAEGLAVEGSVFLIGVTCPGRISLATASIGGQLALHGATIGPLTAQGARIGASVHLRAADGQPFTATGEVSLASAEIGGQLACDGARITNPGKIALNLQRARIAGDAVFRAQGNLPFQTEGEVHLSGADIAGQLDFAGAHLSNAGGHALFAPRMQVGAEFFWQDVTVAAGDVHIPSAHVGDLVDDLASWPDAGRTYLDGFTYDRITRNAPVDAETRLQWLARATRRDGKFLPQPYTQAAATLARMGHEAEARQIMAEQARLKGHARRATRRARGGPLAPPIIAFDWLWDRAALLIVGYGYHPFRSLLWLLALSLLSAFLALMAWDEGSMAPNNDLIAASDGWQAILAQDCVPDPTPGCLENPADFWNGVDGPGLDWESFHPLAYGVDVVVPVLELGQTQSWSPSKDRGPWGHTLWWARWFLMLAGWVVTALGAAAATGIIQRGTPT